MEKFSANLVWTLQEVGNGFLKVPNGKCQSFSFNDIAQIICEVCCNSAMESILHKEVHVIALNWGRKIYLLWELWANILALFKFDFFHRSLAQLPI